jgi:hypothetical protein
VGRRREGRHGRPPDVRAERDHAGGQQRHRLPDPQPHGHRLPPRGGDADDEKATIFQKVAMQVADENKLHWVETQVYSDGLIQQRGYFDIRMNFDSNITGDIVIRDSIRWT